MKKAVTYLLIAIGIVLIVLMNYKINQAVHEYFNRPSLDALEERVQSLQLQANTTQVECIDELDRIERVMKREENIFLQSEPTNGK